MKWLSYWFLLIISFSGMLFAGHKPFERKNYVAFSNEQALISHFIGDRHAQEQYEQGLLFEDGFECPKDDAQAMVWYRRAAEQGHVKAQYHLGHLLENSLDIDWVEVVRWYESAARAGHHKAQNNLGRLYENGLGVVQSFEKAANWYWKAALQGDFTAQYNLGILFKYGAGVRKSFKLAHLLFSNAAPRDREAKYELGLLYQHGRGVRRSNRKATFFYKQAADEGSEDAQYALATLFDAAGELDQAMHYYNLASEQGHMDARSRYNALYEQSISSAIVELHESLKRDERDEVENESILPPNKKIRSK